MKNIHLVISVAGAMVLSALAIPARAAGSHTTSTNVAVVPSFSGSYGDAGSINPANYPGVTMTQVDPSSVHSAADLAAYDTVILWEFCDVSSYPAFTNALIDWLKTYGGKLIIWDSDSCNIEGGTAANYDWLVAVGAQFDLFTTGQTGMSGESLTILEMNGLGSTNPSSPYYIDTADMVSQTDAVGDLNCVNETNAAPVWCALMWGVNILGYSGYTHMYSQVGGLMGAPEALIIYCGLDSNYYGGAGSGALALEKVLQLELAHGWGPPGSPEVADLICQVPPTIITQPVPVTVATNGSCAFFVSAAGNGLGYQWYRNGTNLLDGGNISGSTKSLLIISPVRNSDQATSVNGYSVKITGTGGYTTNSVTNSLALVAVTNLIYNGDGGPTWDVNTTASWQTNNSNDVDFDFNFGDPVTFNDAGFGGAVTLAGPYLSAASVTVTGRYAYVFASSSAGSFAGPGGLFDMNTNKLEIDNANTYSGGTVISNAPGSLQLGSLNGLGTGPVTNVLAGGLMEISVAGSASLSIPNDFVIATNFTIQFDGAGTYAGVFSGNFYGNHGAILTFIAPAANSPTNEQVRFYGTNTTYNGNLVLSNALITLAPYEASGFTQIYNGVISGTGALTQRGGGTTLLNGTNTYTGPTTVSDGTLQVNGSLNAASAVTVNLNATLAGTGTINGPVTVNAGGTLAPGASIGTITLSGGLTLNGNLLFEINTSVSPSNDFASVTGTLTNAGTGTLTVTNLGPALVAGNTFKLFNKALTNAVALTTNLPALTAGLVWSNALAVDGSLMVVSASSVIIPTNSPTITSSSFSLISGNVTLNGTNAQTGGTYYLLASPNVTNKLSLWTPVWTNVVVTNGANNAFTFIGTNVITPGSGQQFYILSNTN
jgi:autotransporter-associated beta strand protein